MSCRNSLLLRYSNSLLYENEHEQHMFHYGEYLEDAWPICHGILNSSHMGIFCFMIFWTWFFAKLYCNTCRFSTTVVIADCLPFASLVKLLQLNCISSQYCFSAVVTTCVFWGKEQHTDFDFEKHSVCQAFSFAC